MANLIKILELRTNDSTLTKENAYREKRRNDILQAIGKAKVLEDK